MTRCPACPCPADVPCLSGRFPVFCEWARDQVPSGLQLIVSRSRRGDGDLAADPTPQPRAAPGASHTRSYFGRLAIIKTCLYRDSWCKCELPRCHAGRGDWDDGRQTSVANCLDCLGLDR